MGARVVNGFLGLWLFVSAFLWQTPAQQWNDWIAGAIVATAALAGLSGAKGGRYVNVAVGVWLILSAIILPRRHVAVFWNNLLVGFAIAVLALVASVGDLRRQRPARV